jgi:hypothetical protein
VRGRDAVRRAARVHSDVPRRRRAALEQVQSILQHLSAPAPGRGSSGVHESGFGRFNTETLNLSPNAIPTLQVVDDTFAKHRDVMAAIIQKAKERAGI